MKPLELIAVAASLLLLPTLSRATGWECEPDIEVRCSDTSCSMSEDQGTIPVGLSFDSHGKFSLCAYSGCWEGIGKVASTAPFLVITVAKAAWSSPHHRAEDREDVLIAFSPSDHIVLIKVESFAMPMRCTPIAAPGK
jgi:hypothetical protein